MAEHGHVPTEEQDQKLEAVIGHMLRTGVLTSALVILIGGILTLRHGGPIPDYTRFHATLPAARSISGTISSALHGSSLGILQLGVLLLIATPVVRVVFALLGFGREKDWLYTLVSGIVLAVLLYSLFHGS